MQNYFQNLKTIIDKLAHLNLGRYILIVGVSSVIISIFLRSKALVLIGFALFVLAFTIDLSLAFLDLKMGTFKYEKYYNLYPIVSKFRWFTLEQKRKLLKASIFSHLLLIVLSILIFIKGFFKN